MKTHVTTPLPLLYIHGKEWSILPYLDVKEKLYIWGIRTNDLVFKLNCENKGNWYYAQRIAKQNPIGDRLPFLPTRAQLKAICPQIEDFNATVMILKEHGIHADVWKDGYWTAESSASEQGYGFNVQSGLEFVSSRLDDCAHIRLALHV